MNEYIRKTSPSLIVHGEPSFFPSRQAMMDYTTTHYLYDLTVTKLIE